MNGLDLLRLLLGAGFLANAALRDLRTRRVPNGLWIVLGTCAALLFLVDFVVTRRLGWLDVLVALLVVGAAYALWYVHVIPGGADAKALMVLAILLPDPIRFEWDGAAYPLWASPLPGAVTTWANAAFTMALLPLGFLLYNLLRGDASWPAMLLGTKMRLDHAERRFVWIVDWRDPDGRERQVLFPSRRSEEEQRANIERLRLAGHHRVWVTPKFPFMLNLLAGFLAAFTVGDILYKLVDVIVRRAL